MKASDALAASLVDLVESIATSSSLESLQQKYLQEIGRFIDCPAAGLYLLSPKTGEAESFEGFGVSDYFLSRYEELGRAKDPVLHYVLQTQSATHNRALMSLERWRSLEVYDEVFRLHRMANLLEAPVVSNGRLIGTLNFGSDDSRPFSGEDAWLATTIGRLIGVALESLLAQETLQREQEHLVASLELCDEAIVLTDLHSGRRRLNAAARRILDRLPEGADGGGYIDELMAAERRERECRVGQLEVKLLDGRSGVLRLHSVPLPENPAMVVAFLTLTGADATSLPRFVEQSLTPREREVAQLVALGLQDGEIANRLRLSPFTVKQYLKSTYRKLALRSRVDLTRLLTENRVAAQTPSFEGVWDSPR